VVTHPAALERWRVAGTGQQMCHAGARPERGDVVGRAVRIRPGVPVTGDQPVHQTRVEFGHRLEVQSDASKCARADIGDENVGAAE
jgi:hypothetical protein